MISNSVNFYRNGHEHITIIRNIAPPEQFIDNNWKSYGCFYNNNDESLFGTIDADIALTIYDTINKRNNNKNTLIQHYSFARLRPQLSCNRIPYAIDIINNFFQDTSLIAQNFGDTSGGMVSHCIYRDMYHTYVAYISMNSGPYAIDIIDQDYVNYLDPNYVSSYTIGPNNIN
jgi:hypothetical protein